MTWSGDHWTHPATASGGGLNGEPSPVMAPLSLGRQSLGLGDAELTAPGAYTVGGMPLTVAGVNGVQRIVIDNDRLRAVGGTGFAEVVIDAAVWWPSFDPLLPYSLLMYMDDGTMGVGGQFYVFQGGMTDRVGVTRPYNLLRSQAFLNNGRDEPAAAVDAALDLSAIGYEARARSSVGRYQIRGDTPTIPAACRLGRAAARNADALGTTLFTVGFGGGAARERGVTAIEVWQDRVANAVVIG